MAGTSEDENNSRKKKKHKQTPSATDQASEACFARAGANAQARLTESSRSMPCNLPQQQASLGNDENPGKPKTKGKSKAASKAISQKRPTPSGMQSELSTGIKTSAGKSAAPGRGGSLYVGRRKGFIDDSELPEDESAEEKKRRLNRNNERRKRARRVFKIDFLSERKGALAEKNLRIRNDNEALRNQIAIIRDRLQSGGNLADIDLTEGATSILSAAEAAALAASTPSPPAGLESPGDQVPSTRARLRASNAHLLTVTGAAQAREALSPQASKGSPQHAARGPPHASPEQSQAQVPQRPLTAFHSALDVYPPSNNEMLQALQRETLMQGRLGQGSGLTFASHGLGTAASGLRQNAIFASWRQDNALPRLSAMGGLATTSEISRLRQELLQVQQAATVNSNVASLYANRLPTGPTTGFGRQIPDLTRRSSDQMSPATLQQQQQQEQQVFGLSSRTSTAASGLGSSIVSQLRSQLGHQPTSALQYSGLLSHLSGAQPQHPTNHFSLTALHHQQQQQQQQQHYQSQWSSAVSHGPRSPSNRVGANLLSADNVLNTYINAQESARASSLGAAGNLLGGFGLQPRMDLAANWRDASSVSMSHREAGLLALLAAHEEQRHQEAMALLLVAGRGDAKRDDDDAENNQPQDGQDPYSARPQR